MAGWEQKLGWGMSAVVVAFMLMDGGMKLALAQPVIDTMTALGYPAGTFVGIGALGLLCTVLYAVPATSVLGAVLLTGYMGGAIATNVRVGAPLFSHFLFPVYVAILAWGGLLLRRPELWALLGLK